MSEEFKIQKDTKRTMDITPGDLDDINLDELKDIDFNNEFDKSSEGSLVFTKEKMSVPVSAGTFDPDTGASANAPPRLLTSLLAHNMSSGVTVAHSTSRLPEVTPERIPPGCS